MVLHHRWRGVAADMKAKRIPLLDAVNEMDRQMMWQGFKPSKYQPRCGEVLIRFYHGYDGRQASMAFSHMDVMLNRIEFSKLVAWRIKKIMNQCRDGCAH